MQLRQSVTKPQLPRALSLQKLKNSGEPFVSRGSPSGISTPKNSQGAAIIHQSRHINVSLALLLSIKGGSLQVLLRELIKRIINTQ